MASVNVVFKIKRAHKEETSVKFWEAIHNLLEGAGRKFSNLLFYFFIWNNLTTLKFINIFWWQLEYSHHWLFIPIELLVHNRCSPRPQFSLGSNFHGVFQCTNSWIMLMSSPFHKIPLRLTIFKHYLPIIYRYMYLYIHLQPSTMSDFV